MKTIDEILKRNGLYYRGINRISYTGDMNGKPYDFDYCLEKIKEIGTVLCERESKKFVIDSENDFVFHNMIYWFEGDKQCAWDLNKGIMLIGTTGTGKTRAIEIMDTYCEFEGVAGTNDLGIKFFADDKLVLMDFKAVSLPRATENIVSKNDFTDYQKCLSQKSIFIDEIGLELKKIKYYGNEVETFISIIEARSRFAGLMMATSNLTLDEIRSVYGDRVESRLSSLVTIVEMSGADRRKI